MTGPFERALGEDFDALHPRVRRRYELDSDSGRACVGRGHLSVVSRNPLAVPALALGARRNVLFPERGTDVPIAAWSIPFRDDAGRESLALVRTFDVRDRRRRFDALFRYDADRDRLVDTLGTDGRLVVDFRPSVVDGGLRLAAGRQRIQLDSRSVPIPKALSVDVSVDERFDEAAGDFCVAVTIMHRLLGPFVHYRGRFTTEYVDVADVPASIYPSRGGAAP